MSGSNRALWKALQINENKSWCMHPITNENIYFFADAPHLLKLIRNWLLDTGFVLSDNSSKTPLLELLKINAGEYKVCCKLTETHILCEKSQRQNVRLASQLFSESTAAALERYKSGSDPKLCCDLAHFIKEVNNWFHIFNSYIPEIFEFPCKSAYEKYITTQDAAIDNFCKTVKNMRCTGKKSLQVFQKDALENTFSQLRSRGGLDDHPTPLSALYRLRMVIIGKNGFIGARGITNTKGRLEGDYLISKVLRHAGVKVNVGNDDKMSFSYSENSDTEKNIDCPSEKSELKLDMSITEKDGLSYIAGWIAKTHHIEYPNLGEFTYKLKEDPNCISLWIQHLSHGGLI
ncbi:Transposable element P transposase, partial [Stegodyphus mimosarum]